MQFPIQNTRRHPVQFVAIAGLLAWAWSPQPATAAEAPVVLAENGITTAVIVVEKSLLPRPEGPAAPMRGRYVRLEQPSDRVMVAEVEVFSGGVNVAKGKAATQKGQWGGCAPTRAVDGDTNAEHDKCSVGDIVGWWEVDLGGTVAIEKIVVWNVAPPNDYRMAHLMVSVLDENRTPEHWYPVRAAAPRWEFDSSTALAGDAANIHTAQALKDLRHYLQAVTGAEFALKREGEETAPETCLYYGSAARRKLGLDRATPAGDEWAVKTQGNDLFLCGTQPPDNDLFVRSRRRGGDTCAVDHFLEDLVGVHRWSAQKGDVPIKPSLSIPPTDLRQRLSLWDLAQGRKNQQRIPEKNPQCIKYIANSLPLAVNLCTPRLGASLWGPSGQLTISLQKPDVFDRRCVFDKTLTVEELRQGCFDPANATDAQPPGRGDYLNHLKQGGGVEMRYGSYAAYDFPVAKPVGQIILMMDDFKGQPEPEATIHHDSGLVETSLTNQNAHADLQVLSMKTRNVIALKLNCQNANQPVRFRLYRHQDTCQPGKMWRFGNPDPDGIKEPAPWPGYDYAKNGNIDAAIEPPKAGAEGDYFWITQRLPAEKTFPNGFHYVLMGRVVGGKVTAETAEGVKHLGTPPYAGKEPGSAYQIYPIHAPIREAAGAAATASVAHAGKVDAVLYTTVVTLAESQDPMAEARKQLDAAIERGFDRLVQDERAWFKAQYERRESGRVFVEGFNADEAESLAAFSDWGEIGGTLPCKPDVDRYEAIFGGYEFEQDVQPWHGLKPWDELFDTEYFVRNRADKQERYRKLPRYWLPAGKRQAWDVFRLPGMYLNVGYTPPILPDRMWNTCDTYDFCVSLTPALVKLAWDTWDYGGGEEILHKDVYPPLRELAIFFHAFAQLGADGCYHVLPVIPPEHWGWTYRWKYNVDSIGALCMAKWTLLRAAEAAELLGVDEDLRAAWRERAGALAPYPIADTPQGKLFCELPGIDPYAITKLVLSHQTDINCSDQEVFFPCVVSDEINLESPAEQREIMIRTALELTAYYNLNNRVHALLGSSPDEIISAWGADRVTRTKIDSPARLYEAVTYQPERVLNSRSGRMHLFACVPADASVAFRDFQARGGFLVSAEMKKGVVTSVRITARRDVECKLKNPWPGKQLVVSETGTKATVPCKSDKDNPAFCRFRARKGATYELSIRENQGAASKGATR